MRCSAAVFQRFVHPRPRYSWRYRKSAIVPGKNTGLFLAAQRVSGGASSVRAQAALDWDSYQHRHDDDRHQRLP